MSTPNPNRSPKLAWFATIFFVVLFVVQIVLNSLSNSNAISQASIDFTAVLVLVNLFLALFQSFPGGMTAFFGSLHIPGFGRFLRRRLPVLLLGLVTIVSLVFNGISLVQQRQTTPTLPITFGLKTPTTTRTPFPTATASITPTALASPVPAGNYAYDFEGGSTGWDSDYQSFNPAFALGISADQAYSGTHSLKVTTRFLGDQTSAFQHLPDQGARNVYTMSNAKVYFTQEQPTGFSGAETYSFQGKILSCFVYFPVWILSGGIGKAKVALFAKDRLSGGSEPNSVAHATLLDSSTTNKWIQLQLDFANAFNDSGFDPKQVGAIGVQVTILSGSTIQQTGSYYIDACTLPQ